MFLCDAHSHTPISYHDKSIVVVFLTKHLCDAYDYHMFMSDITTGLNPLYSAAIFKNYTPSIFLANIIA